MREVKVEFGPGLKDVMGFTKQLAVMIKAGINIRSAIGGIAQQVENPKFQKIIQQIKSDVESGETFSEALAKHGKVFPHSTSIWFAPLSCPATSATCWKGSATTSLSRSKHAVWSEER